LTYLEKASTIKNMYFLEETYLSIDWK